MSELEKALCFVGVITILVIIGVILIAITELIKDKVDSCRRKYVYKHRFNKPPIAKCYCKDCKYWSDYDGECFSHSGWRTADNWFCWSAEPR